MARRRRPQLDGTQKNHILAIVSVGASRRFAAQYVGCTVQSIQNAARRDPEFAKALRQTERQSTLTHLKNLQSTAKQERYWRASTWSLERQIPQEFAHRGPDTITRSQLHELLTQIVRILIEAIPVPSIRKNVVKQLKLLLRTLGQPVQGKPPTGMRCDGVRPTRKRHD